MGNWTVVIKGVGPKPPVSELAHDFVKYLSEQGQTINSAEFISDTVEHSANLLAERDDKASVFTPRKDGGLGYEKPEPQSEPKPSEPGPSTTEPEPTEENTKPTETADGAP